MFEIRQTEKFSKWFDGLKNKNTKSRINERLKRISLGNFGDIRTTSIREISELRFAFGGGVRIYITRYKDKVILLLNGGDKSSQERDIKKAKEVLDEFRVRYE